MSSKEIRERFLKFFEERGHKVVSSSSLVPEGDSSVLFTTAGMQQFKPYYIGKKDPKSDLGGLNAVSIQKCVRTSDIEEVGDERHLTFFEMLGNFSFGGYWKTEAIQYAYDFVTKEMELKIGYVTVFEGNDEVPIDSESQVIWSEIKEKNNESFEIKKFGREDNFWGPTGDEGPCGPTTEIYVDGIEIWNIVFNEFYQSKEGSLNPLEIKGIDTGMGLERLALVSQFPGQLGEKTIFDTDLFNSIIYSIIEIVSDKSVEKIRIVADHLRAATFMIADGATSSNIGSGYVLRRLLRRAMLIHRKFIGVGMDIHFYEKPIETIINAYKRFYPELDGKKDMIVEEIRKETEKFSGTLDKGLKQFNWMARTFTNGKLEKQELPASIAFDLATTYGFPFELIEEEARERGMNIDKYKFESHMESHRIKSKAGSEQKFKGGLAGHSEMEVKYHTTTHLLHQALRDVLGNHVEQKGSNITPERLRFDFSHPTKMTDEEKEKVENIVNEKIKESLSVKMITLPKQEAEKIGALHFFGDKYGDEVSVYYIGPSLAEAYSKEFCGGPHVERTSDLAGSRNPERLAKDRVFKILKEEAVSQGIRRIKAILE